MAWMGAEVLLYPTAIGSEPPPAPPIDSRGHWQRVMQGHAAANYLPLVASNRVGTEAGRNGQMTFYGSSFITDPTGSIVAELNGSEESVTLHAFDLDDVAQMRASWGLFRDRRPDLYGALRSHDGVIR
jgi:N-carbamoylputrescine amidase